MRALRTIDKEGGLDNYLLGEKPARIKELGMGGWLLRWRIMNTNHVRRRVEQERQTAGGTAKVMELPLIVESISGNEGDGPVEENVQDGLDAVDEALDDMDRNAESGEQEVEDNGYDVPPEDNSRQPMGEAEKPLATA